MQAKDVVMAYCVDLAHNVISDVNLVSDEPYSVTPEYIQAIYEELLKNSMIIATNEQIVLYKKTRSQGDIALENNAKSGYWLCWSDVDSEDILFSWYFSRTEAEAFKAKIDALGNFNKAVIIHVEENKNENAALTEKETVYRLRAEFLPGTVVELIRMEGEPQMFAGLHGIVKGVDDAGQIHVNWQNGSSLALVPAVDEFIKLEGK